MLVRIVKLTFEIEYIPDFLQIFEVHKESIKDFEGFISLELYQDKSNPQVFFTYSHWDDESALNNYRNSEYFKAIWSRTKLFFADTPEVWSLDKL
ncbi:antibiotic biosynthesis monooxygenase [Aurantibacter crassamenti]|uniref:putative quinol monooxygenase n=1 Tax=Aurantibacter crassamenti TaxID=1837375 RepID=UPI00193AAAEF|nr:antibiotic biosynthesis monooxygenase family protein [Aurantibacter crassamenti]MBM1106816.1 antibiotic biosynthesis monooxygenase [Aurantibacter crassamenti]